MNFTSAQNKISLKPGISSKQMPSHTPQKNKAAHLISPRLHMKNNVFTKIKNKQMRGS